MMYHVCKPKNKKKERTDFPPVDVVIITIIVMCVYTLVGLPVHTAMEG